MKLIIVFISLISLILFVFTIPTLATSPSNITIDYTKSIRSVTPLQFGMDESTYGSPSVLINDLLQRNELKKLQVGYMRITLIYQTPGDPTSGIICAASGCPKTYTADQWVNAVKSIGAEPIIEISDYLNPTSATDAANLVKHFNKDTNNYVKTWLIGNEPDLHSVDGTTYSNAFNSIYDAIKAVDPTIKIGGPATAWYDDTFIQTFLNISGNRTDFVDFHAYDRQSLTADVDLGTEAPLFETHINSVRQKIQATVPARSSQIDIHIGEWNLKSTAILSEETILNTVWGTSVIGHILNAGGFGLQYADKGGLGGALYSTAINGQNIDDPLPIYHATGMFTGESLFQHFGTILVNSSTTLTNIEVFSSDNPKNIVVVNKDPSNSQQGIFSFIGGLSAGAIDVWREDQTTNPSNPPVKVGTIQFSNSSFTYSLPPYSVTTFVISSPASTPSLIPGDANSDGKVDGIDYIVWLIHFGQTTTNGYKDGDFDNDGKVDNLDYTIWFNNRN